MNALLYKWVKTNASMLFNAASLVGTFVVKAGLGFAFWWLAARRFTPEAVGFASATLSAMTLLGTCCMLGLGTLLIRELPRQRGQEVTLMSTALLLVAAVGGCVGLLFALTAPFFSHDLQPLRSSIEALALLAAGASLTTVNLVLDQALLGFLRGDLQLGRNILFASTKLLALTGVAFWLAQRTGLSIVVTWVAGDALSLLALGGFAVMKGMWNGRIARPRWHLLRKMGPSAMQHHGVNLLLLGPNLALPLLVTALLSATINAWFYVAFLVADIVYVIPQALVTALYAVSSAQPAVLARKARLTLILAGGICVLANIVLILGSRQLLGLFGPDYVQQGTWSMCILGLGALPFIIKDHYVTICRIRDQMTQALPLLAGGAALEIGLAALGARLDSLSGLSLGWVLAVGIEAVCMSRLVYRAAWPASNVIVATTQDEAAGLHGEPA